MLEYSVIQNGQERYFAPATVDEDRVVWFSNGKTCVVLHSECEARGLTVEQVQEARGPLACLGKLGDNPNGIKIIRRFDWLHRN